MCTTNKNIPHIKDYKWDKYEVVLLSKGWGKGREREINGSHHVNGGSLARSLKLGFKDLDT